MGCADESERVRQGFADALASVAMQPYMDESYQTELVNLPAKLSQIA